MLSRRIAILAAIVAVATAAGLLASAQLIINKPVEMMGHVWLGQMRFAESLHATTKGMKYWYMRGMYKVTHIPYEKLFCAKCHATCESCHGVTGPNGKVVDFSVEKAEKLSTCLKCHGRERAVFKVASKNPEFTEIHMMGYGVSCTFCHTSMEVHGMYDDFNYMFDKGGVVKVTCEDCHLHGMAIPPFMTIEEHRVHLKDISCEVCHARTTVTCYSCHLSEAYEKYRRGEKFSPEELAVPIVGWLPIVRDPRTGKIVPANFMVIVWDANGTEAVHVDIAKHFPHFVNPEGLTCKDCHGIQAAKTLLEKGVLRITWYENGTLYHIRGIIPIVNGTKLELTTVIRMPDGSLKPFKTVIIDVNSHLIENTLPLSLKDLKYLAKSPEELEKQMG